MLTRLHITSFLGLTVVAWLIALWAQGTPLITLDFLRPFVILVGIITGVATLFIRYAWSWKVFQGWYVRRPDVRGTWKVELQSDWINPETKQPIPTIVAYAAIRQSLTSLSLRLMTPESKSKLIAHSIELEEDGVYRLAGVYRNEPNIGLQGRHSNIHHGALSLEIYGSPPTNLEGHYWTDRNTRGEMKLSNRVATLYDTYAAAKAGFRH
jgi:hypothetical protein